MNVLVCLAICSINVFNQAIGIPSIVNSDSLTQNVSPAKGSKSLKDYETDFYFEDKQIIRENSNDISPDLQRLYATLNHIQDTVNKLETKSNAILDRLTILDCYDLKLQDPTRAPGIYDLYLDHVGKRPVSVYCDMVTDGGGWTVIQQRLVRDYNSSGVNFDRPYHEYELGFGTPDGDYWIGLGNLHVWTNSRNYELRIYIEDFNNNTGHALYDRFHVGNADSGYRLHVGKYSGDIGDSLGSNSSQDNYTAHGMRFSSWDMDQDTSYEINCSKFWNIGGWWFNRCSWANLNGPYQFPRDGIGIGINWHKWKNTEYLQATKMMIRPLKKEQRSYY